MTDDTELDEKTDAQFTIELLTRAVQLATGNDDAGPREGQAAFTKNVANAMTLGGEGEVVGIMPTGTGKALDIATPIPTPSGWTTMGELQAGDLIFDERGRVTTVTHAHPVQEDRPCYLVTFSDGSSIVADAEHLWDTSTRLRRRRYADLKRRPSRGVHPSPKAQLDDPLFQTVTTETIRHTLMEQSGALNHALPENAALQGEERSLPVAPYTLGAWLGDGTSTTSGFTSADEEVLEAIREDGYIVRALSGRYAHSIRLDDEARTLPGADSFTRRLEAANVLGNKHIPDMYQRASFEQRLSLLQGLVDTDGTVDARSGRCEVALTSERLARDVLQLVRSLGIVASLRTGPAAITEDGVRREVGVRHRVGFTTALPVARLARKKSRLPVQVAERARRRYIKSVEPVESRPVRCITVAAESHLFLAGDSMVATHNSFSALSTAAARAVRHRERSVISTESLSLQAQYAEKDAPTMQAAVLDLTGYELDVAVMKGFSNYVCGQRAAMSAMAALSMETAPTTGKQLRETAARLEAGEGTPAPLMEELGADADNVLPLVTWALGQHFGPETGDVGDRFSYEGKMTSRDWNAVSISSADCIGKECPLRDVCKIVQAREHARNADIVITNHSILAVQAANNIPVLIGSKSMERESDDEGFKHLIVDEAHTLPGQVRSQGSNELSGGKVISAARAVSRVIDDAGWVKRGEQLAELVEQQISQLSGGKDERKLVQEDDPMLEPLAKATKAWAKEGTSALKVATTSPSPNVRIRANRASNALTMLVAAAETVAEYKAGVARWIERPQYGATKRAQWHVAHASPVDVSNNIKNSLWNTPVRPNEDGTYPDPTPITGIVMSATLPSRFAMQVGMEVQERDYPSPFDTAYGSSVLYIPRADNPVDIAELGSQNRWTNKVTFDTKKHALWAAEHVVELCKANGGAALVIGATGDNARLYADMLRMKTDLRVLSQWDGEGLRQLMDEWREDENSVLVGTRSLMTGVDAPGQTCSLVILDRPPRSAGNPVDDARVDALTQRLGDKWAADRYVYVADAAALTEQAAGRLIRSVSDHGMFALLDPRLLKVGNYKYPAPTRELYMKSVRRFTNKMAGKEESRAWLKLQRERRLADDSDAL